MTNLTYSMSDLDMVVSDAVANAENIDLLPESQRFALQLCAQFLGGEIARSDFEDILLARTNTETAEQFVTTVDFFNNALRTMIESL